MIQTQLNLNLEKPDKILCFYINNTSYIQIVRLTNIAKSKYERVVFPKERFFFEADLDAQLEIYMCEMDKKILSAILPCDRIQVNEENSVLKSGKESALAHICL
ncbi:DUF1830 domain-containing protein [Argonema galeatum]|uniref:DUF1830 domain-containing protein n=1 Tax=Argonema galeatum TaxID=2942762 RepID=UPI002010FCDA|nr:DUF1830 domain-containing protein [Argonema galeatum]MCL1464994.1 DUF1830 domain-containing protein [Argonema galeatum A003/A1]